MPITNAAYRQIAVMKNPFEEVMNPKIPDGQCSQSLGFKNQAVADFVIGEDVVNIFFFPGIGAGMFIDKRRINDTTVGSAWMRFDNEHLKFTFGGGPAPLVSLTQDDATLAARWRVVSQACKVTLVNGTDDNDGWWEAIRFVPPKTPEDYDANDASGVIPAPVDGSFWGKISVGYGAGTNMINTPGYTTGKLRDLHKHMFYLQTHQNSHPFRELEKVYQWSNDEPQAHEWEQTLNALWDHSMDVVLLRIHGNSQIVANSCCKPTRLMFHLVQNQEVIYANNGILSQLMTRSESADASVQKAYASLSRSPAPSMGAKTAAPKGMTMLKTRARSYKRTGTTKKGKSKKAKK